MAVLLLPLVASLIGCQIVGMLWYSPILFGTRWASYAYPGRRLSDLGGKDGTFLSSIIFTAAVATVWIVILHYIIRQAVVTWNVKEVIQLALLLSALVSLLQVPHYLFEGKLLKHLLINGGFDAAVILQASVAVYYLGA